MINITEVKMETKKNRNTLLDRPINTSDPFRPQAKTDYDIKKEKEKKAIHDEINRAYIGSSIV